MDHSLERIWRIGWIWLETDGADLLQEADQLLIIRELPLLLNTACAGRYIKTQANEFLYTYVYNLHRQRFKIIRELPLLLNTTCIAQVEIQKDRQINTDTYTICINTNVTCTGRDTKTCSHASKNTKCTYRDTKTEAPTLRCKQSNFVAKNTNKILEVHVSFAQIPLPS